MTAIAFLKRARERTLDRWPSASDAVNIWFSGTTCALWRAAKAPTADNAKGLVLDATICESVEQAKAFWRIRELFGEVQGREGGSIKHDVSVPVANIPAFITEANAAAVKLIPGSRPLPFGHVGDGNIHYNVSQPVGADKAEFIKRWDDMNDVIYKVVLKYGGSVSAEHGVGIVKRDYLPKIKDPVAYDLMKTLKRTLDPKGILNPGKVL